MNALNDSNNGRSSLARDARPLHQGQHDKIRFTSVLQSRASLKESDPKTIIEQSTTWPNVTCYCPRVSIWMKGAYYYVKEAVGCNKVVAETYHECRDTFTPNSRDFIHISHHSSWYT